jgi:WD40 repeat protein
MTFYRPRYAFISYSRQSRQLAQEFRMDLQSIIKNVWIDERIVGTFDWWQEILKQIRHCDLFILALTASALKSDYCYTEYRYAHSLNKLILPIVLDNDAKSILEETAVDTPFLHDLRAIQYIDYRLMDKKALRELGSHILQLPTPTPSPDPLPTLPAKPPPRAAPESVKIIKTHGDRVESINFDSLGRRIVTASFDEMVIVQNVNDLQDDAKAIKLKGHNGVACYAAFSPDGDRVVSCSWDSTAIIWDIISAKPIIPLIGHKKRVLSVAYSPDSQYIVTASADNTAIIWNAASGQQMVQLVGHTDWIRRVTYSPDGDQIATASRDCNVIIWDARSGHEFERLAHLDPVYSAYYSPDGSLVVTACADRIARIWSVSGAQEKTQLIGHKDKVYRAKYSPDGHRIVTVSKDRTGRIWTSTGESLLVLTGHEDSVLDADFDPNGQIVATASWDGTIRLWSICIQGIIE